MPTPFFRVPLSLKHAATLSKRIVYHLQRLKTSGANTLDNAISQALELRDLLRLFEYSEDNPPPEECAPVVAEAARRARELVDEIERTQSGDDRLGQAVRNFFECLELGEEGARISLRAGENPDSALRPH